MDIGYKNFKEDCKEVIGKYLEKYNFHEFSESLSKDEQEHSSIYKNDYWILEISMISNFPHIGISCDFLSLDSKTTRKSIIDKALNIDTKDITKFYNEFIEFHDLNNYKNQMQYCIENLDKFYKPIITGEFTYEMYLSNIS